MLPGLWLAVGGVLLCGTNPEEPAGPRVRIGSKSFTESVILGEIAAHVIRDAGGVVEHRAELGGTQVLWKALLAGEIDVYAEYTGTLRQEILAGAPIPDEAAMRAALAEQNIVMGARLGFHNGYALGMKRETAQALGIHTISDLVKHPDLKYGLSDEFLERNDGWPGLRERYQLPSSHVRGLDHALTSRGLDSGSHQVSDLYTTDAEIRYYQFTVLEDDRGYFPAYHAVFLYRADLEERFPDGVAALKQLEGKLTNEVMIDLNAQSQVDRRAERQIAADFLEAKLGLSIAASPVESAWRRMWERLLWRTSEHLYLVAISLTAAVLVAVPLGIMAAKYQRLGQGLLGVVGVIQTLPSLAVLVCMIPILGLGARPAIMALFLYSLLPIVRNTYTGLRDIPGHLRESALVIGLPAWQRLWWIELPLASRSLLAGIKTAAVINVGTATIGALVGAGGYGQPILTGIRLDDMGLILQGAVPAAVLALLVQGGFELSERFLVPAGLRVTR